MSTCPRRVFGPLAKEAESRTKAGAEGGSPSSLCYRESLARLIGLHQIPQASSELWWQMAERVSWLPVAEGARRIL